MALVKGNNFIITIYDGGEWKTYACATSAEISIETSLIETSVTGSGKSRTYLPEANGFSGSLSGLVNLDKPGLITLPALLQLQLSHQLLNTRGTFIDEDDNVFIFNGDFYITNTTLAGGMNDAASFNISIQGTGVPALSSTPLTPIITQVKSYVYTATGGEKTFTDALLSAQDILDVEIDGIGYAEIITSGTPVDKQILYDELTGQFSWAPELEPDVKVKILYQPI